MGIDHYFAYGSNMNPERVRERGLRFCETRPARLLGVRLVFDKVCRGRPGAGHANIVYAPAACVEGVLYRLCSAAEMRKMDPFEKAPVNYGRDAVEVWSGGERVPAWTYFANRAMRGEGLMPPRSYLKHMLAGSRYLSAGYCGWLQSVECVD